MLSVIQSDIRINRKSPVLGTFPSTGEALVQWGPGAIEGAGAGCLWNGQWSPPAASVSKIASLVCGMVQQNSGVRKATGMLVCLIQSHYYYYSWEGGWISEFSERLHGESEVEYPSLNRTCFQHQPRLPSEVIIFQLWLTLCPQGWLACFSAGLLVLKSK